MDFQRLSGLSRAARACRVLPLCDANKRRYRLSQGTKKIDLDSFILSPAWLHILLLFVATGIFAVAGRIQLETRLESIGHKMNWVVGVQVFAALTAITATALTYDDLGNDADCLIGLTGYALNGIVLLLLLSLFFWLLVGFRRAPMRSKSRFVFLLFAGSILSLEALAIHVRSFGYCVGAV